MGPIKNFGVDNDCSCYFFSVRWPARTVSFRTDEDVEDDEEVITSKDEVVEHVECPLGRMGSSGTHPNLSFILQRVRGG